MFAIVVSAQKVKNSLKNQKDAKRIDQTLMHINQKYSQDLKVPFHRISQSGFEGVLLKGIYIFEIVDKLKFSLSDLGLVFGIGFCENLHAHDLNLNIDNGLHNAYMALETLAENNDYGNARIQVSLGKHNSLAKVINASLRTTDFIESRWRQSQFDLVKYLILNYGYMESFVQKEVAQALKLSAQNFNQQLKNSGYFNIVSLKREITVIMEQYRRTQYRSL